ncbi:WcaI family glycosyltransferase [Qipengyuania sp. CAU 1752]
MASICLASLNYAPEPIGIGPYSQGWAEALAARGHKVQVVCGEPHYPDWKRDPATPRKFAETTENGVKVLRVPLYIPRDPSGLTRLAHYGSFAVNLARGLAKTAKTCSPDAVIATAPSLLAAPVALRFARRHDALTWLHIQDFEIEAAVATRILPGWIAPVGARFEHAVLSRFDRVSSIAPRMVEKVIAKRGSREGVAEMRNWAEPTVGTSAADPDGMRRKLDLPPGKIALYSGNLARKQGIGIILEAAEILRAQPGLQIVICGDGPAAEETRDAAARLPNLHFRGLQPREDLPSLLAMADMHLLPQISAAADLVLPSKLANMLASGRPVVATADPGTSLAREIEGCGSVVAAGDAAALAAAMLELHENPSRGRELGSFAQLSTRDRWSKKKLVEDFAEDLERAIEERAR